MKSRLRVEALEIRECPAAGSTIVPLATGPGFTLGINNYGRVAEMVVSQAEFDAFSDGSQTQAQNDAIAQRLYATLPDVFDDIIVVSNLSEAELPATATYYGVSQPVQNSVWGTGLPQFNNSSFFGSAGKLQNFIHLSYRSVLNSGTFLHEVMHRWANHLPSVFPGLVDTPGHWGLSSIGGQLGGWERGTVKPFLGLGPNVWEADGPLGENAFAPNANHSAAPPSPPDGGVPYAPLELYLMGLIPATEVPPFDVAINGQMIDILQGIFYADGFQTYTIDDIVAAAGPRLPALGLAQRQFRAITVVVTPTPMTQAQLDEMDTTVEEASKAGPDNDPTHFNFWEATGGRATFQMGNLQQFLPGARPVDSPLAVGTANNQLAVFSPATNGRYDASVFARVQLAPLLGDFSGEIRVATGDVNGDGVPDFAFATGPGGPTRYGVYNGLMTGYIIPPTQPFSGSEGFSGGAFVSCGDLTGDGRAEVIVSADQGGGARVVAFGLGGGVVTDFLGIDDPDFRGGARTAVGDVNGDGRVDLAVVAGFGGGPRVAIYSGFGFGGRGKIVNDFFAFPGEDATRLRNGVFLAIGDVDFDGRSDLVFGAGPGGAPRVFVLDGGLVSSGLVAQAQATPMANFFVNNNMTDRGGVRVAAKYTDQDQYADVVIGSGEGSLGRIVVYPGVSIAAGGLTVLQDVVLYRENLPGGVYVG